MKTKKAEVRLSGRWRLTRKLTINGSSERNLTLFSKEDYTVDFLGDGVMTENCGKEVTTTTYHFDPNTKVISIQGTDRNPPSPISGEKENTFRIIPLNETEMYFQSPHSVEDENTNVEFEMILLEHF